VSRNAVWKAVQALRKEGHAIEAATNRGYRLTQDGDLFTPSSIAAHLGEKAELFRIRVERSLPSTNNTLKALAEKEAPEGTVVAAVEQSEGRGRQGRRFYSPMGGAYFSLLLRPMMSAPDATLITTAAAVAAAEAVEEVTGLPAGIKWVNDVYVRGRKVCGILTEGSFNAETGGLDYVVLGVGVNVEPPDEGYPEDIAGRAGTLFDGPAPPGTKGRLVARVLLRLWDFLPRLEEKPHLEPYRARLFLTGREIDVVAGDTVRRAVALGLDEDFRLRVRYPDGNEEALIGGEVRVVPGVEAL